MKLELVKLRNYTEYIHKKPWCNGPIFTQNVTGPYWLYVSCLHWHDMMGHGFNRCLLQPSSSNDFNWIINSPQHTPAPLALWPLADPTLSQLGRLGWSKGPSLFACTLYLNSVPAASRTSRMLFTAHMSHLKNPSPQPTTCWRKPAVGPGQRFAEGWWFHDPQWKCQPPGRPRGVLVGSRSSDRNRNGSDWHGWIGIYIGTV